VIPLSFLGSFNWKETEDSAEIAKEQEVSWISKEFTFPVEKVVLVDFKLRTPEGRESTRVQARAYVVPGVEWQEFFIGKKTLKDMGLLSAFLE